MNDSIFIILIPALLIALMYYLSKDHEIENNNSQTNTKTEEQIDKNSDEQMPLKNDGLPEVEMQNADIDIKKPLFSKAGTPVRNTINAVKSAVDFVKTNQRLKQAELTNTILMQQMDIMEKVNSDKAKLEEEKLKLELEKMKLENEKLRLELENAKLRAENKTQ